MSDEIFFREVNEEIRHERTRALWSRFGRWILAIAVLMVLATAGYAAWKAYRQSQANAGGDAYLAAIDLASAGKTDEAISAFEAIVAKGHAAYPDLARLRIAATRQASGDSAAAVAAFDAVANDKNAPTPLRDIAALRAGYLLVDTGTRDDVRQRVERLSSDGAPLRYGAREALGLAAWKAGANDEARPFFEGLRDDLGAPSGIAGRARMMLDVIAGGSRPVETAAPSTDGVAADPAAPGAETPLPSLLPLLDTAPTELTPPAAEMAPAAPAPAVEAQVPAPTTGAAPGEPAPTTSAPAAAVPTTESAPPSDAVPVDPAAPAPVIEAPATVPQAAPAAEVPPASNADEPTQATPATSSTPATPAAPSTSVAPVTPAAPATPAPGASAP